MENDSSNLWKGIDWKVPNHSKMDLCVLWLMFAQVSGINAKAHDGTKHQESADAAAFAELQVLQHLICEVSISHETNVA